MEQLKTPEAYAAAMKNGKSMMYFTTNWCPDCFFINPHLNELEETYSDYTWYKVDRDEMIDLCQHLGIMGIPSFVAYEEGTELGRFVSKMRKTKEEVVKFVESL
jgi:thiol-disulfide isomerase/thioredoxin